MTPTGLCAICGDPAYDGRDFCAECAADENGEPSMWLVVFVVAALLLMIAVWSLWVAVAS